MTDSSLTVTAIIPAYNEEKRIHHVLQAVSKSSYIDEIICVNDGSTDNTKNIINSFPNIKKIHLKKNYGKSYAVVLGIKKAKGEIVLFIDADLAGLDDINFKKLILPLLNHTHDVTLGYVCHHSLDILFRPISGERAYYKKDLLLHLDDIKNKGYGLELYLNYLFRDKKVKMFPLKKVKHSLKFEKQSVDFALKLFFLELLEIGSEIVNNDNPAQFFSKSYLFPFYLKKSKKNAYSVKKLIKYIRNNII
ncbi:MAG: glycosyltransferase [bacterium]|nr:glycosyltransferase [bacterium]